MKRILLFVALGVVFATQYSVAQVVHGLKGSYNTERFPEVSFVWNTADPDVLGKSQFVLTDENNKPIDFFWQVLSPNDVNRDKSILFLWEDMASHSRQTEFTRQLLGRFFTETPLKTSDKFNVAVFNRKKSSKQTVTELLLERFTSDVQQLQNAVAHYPQSSERYMEFPQQSDLYLAINEGVDLLKKESADRSCILVVVTAGLNMKAAGASTEMESVRQNALSAGIPIYVVKYPLSGDAPEVNSLAESTYGLHTSSYDVNNAIVALQGFYNIFDARCYGNDYRITFTTAAKRDGKPHPVKLSVNKAAQLLPPFTAPDMTFVDWMQENIGLFIILIVLFIAIVILTIWLVRRGITERNRKIAENKASLQGEIDKANQDMEVMKRKHEEEKRRQAAEAAQKEKAAEENRLKNLMRTKNLFPRLQCKCPDSSFSFSISQPRITIGRNNGNDLVLDHQTVSGYHADIIFNGTSFEIVNKSRSYTKGIIVNGQFFQQCTLRSGDMIGLGEAVITFYL